MVNSKFNLNDLSFNTINLIQLSIATIISLIFQFLIPFSWQPLDTFLYGINQHGDPGTNFVFFTISQWYFSLSIVWLIFRDNIYINNFLIYSIVPLGIITFYEFFFLYLFYDYIHITPLIVDIYLIWKKKDTLSQKYAPIIIFSNIIWLLSVYFLNLAYYSEDLLIFIMNLLIYTFLWIILSFLIKSKQANELTN